MKHVIATAFLLSASAASAETKTISWFLAHPDARAKVIALCQNNPGEARHVPDCTNALAAMSHQSTSGMISDIDRANRGTSLLDHCAEMGKLFQAVYHCGGAR